jgi:hypothetical protein
LFLVPTVSLARQEEVILALNPVSGLAHFGHERVGQVEEPEAVASVLNSQRVVVSTPDVLFDALLDVLRYGCVRFGCGVDSRIR